MSNNYDDYGYEDSNSSNSGLGRKVLIIALILRIFFDLVLDIFEILFLFI